MMEKLKGLKKQIKTELDKISDIDSLLALEKKYFGRKDGIVNQVLKNLKNLSDAERIKVGQLANEIKTDILTILEKKRIELERSKIEAQLENEWIDTSLPLQAAAAHRPAGHLHPIFQVQYELEDVFKNLNFRILDGPELESDFYNFQAVNIPPDHPSREMQDTFYVKSDKEKMVLRTQTSSVQVRAMREFGAPLRAVIPGKVFRYEATDASHDNTFDQFEGLVVDKDISIANLIATMKILLRAIFKKDVTVRLRPGFFPFVEPAFELDMKCLVCGGAGCSVCKRSGWVEVLPCGLVHPNVLKAGGLDPKEWSGFAFGVGFSRLVMMRYGIEDIRHFNGADLRFLKQF
ncbi:MAG TPA: phenylalanine--tRNA ligase subunit alpha [Candidatus Bipolaricaulota bacterium]|nr:phenylalanine--tRNA ligase subunit alpha [Candidatus Bipolaricaulota bacterium]